MTIYKADCLFLKIGVYYDHLYASLPKLVNVSKLYDNFNLINYSCIALIDGVSILVVCDWLKRLQMSEFQKCTSAVSWDV